MTDSTASERACRETAETWMRRAEEAEAKLQEWENDPSGQGLSLRDYFAAKAMQGLLAQSAGTALTSNLADGATYAYAMADAMLEEREK